VRKILVWCRSHPWLTSLAGLVVFSVGLHLFLNWRAEQRWQEYCAASRARGVKLTLLEFARPEFPDDENFAELPMLQAAQVVGGLRPFALPTPTGKPPMGDAVKRESIVWTSWQAYFQRAGFITEISDDPVRDTLRALDHYAPQFQEWSQWRSRPRSRFALDLKAGAATPFPHLLTFMDAARIFSLKARAHLALGESAAAYAAFREGLQAYRALQEEPALLCGLVRLAVLSTLGTAVGEGLMHRSWAEPELRQIDTDLATVILWEDFRQAMCSERGFVNAVSNDLTEASPVMRGQMAAKNIAAITGLGLSSSTVPPALCVLIPKRVYRDNQLRENHYFDEVIAGVEKAARFDPDRPVPSAPDRVNNVFDRYYYFLSGMSVPVFEMMEKSYVGSQILLDEARLAIALELYHLRTGGYPADLADLVPEFCAQLPRDVYSRGNYRYRPTGDGTFLLYSVGSNRDDNGGRLNPAIPGNDQLDATWLYSPAASPPSKAESSHDQKTIPSIPGQ
jgi:hypothetical protein